MLDDFQKFCAELGLESGNVERFSELEQQPAEHARNGFDVALARSKKAFFMTLEKYILDTPLDAGMGRNYSCSVGVCGSCETPVLAGEPDHRDSVLSPSERVAAKTMMICVSGCGSSSLKLDL